MTNKQNTKESSEKACDMCKPYGKPGFVLNANQWVPCWQCNPRPSNFTPAKKEIVNKILRTSPALDTFWRR